MAGEEKSRMIVGGWVLAREVLDPATCLALRAPRLLTISDCIQDDLPRPEPWFGDWFHDVDQARQAATSAPGARPVVLTVALHAGMAADFMAEWDDEAPWFDLLRKGLPLPESAHVLGYEVVGAEDSLDFHSWHCHGYADEAEQALGVHVNQIGLIPSLTEAQAILAWILERPDAEAPAPVPWTVVALAQV